MCGVFGYVGSEKQDLAGFLLSGLTSLEYRGYDSAGLAILTSGRFQIIKATGELANLKKLLVNKKIKAGIGIGHTRWATHGGVTKANAHPHTSCKGNLVVVHNGVMENFQEIKKELIKKRHRFVSQTDTEIFAHLVEEKLKNQKINFPEAVRRSFNEIKGLNAVVCVSQQGEMVAFREGSPLVVGVGRDGFLVSSDIPAMKAETDKIIFLADGEGVILNQGEIVVLNKNGQRKKVNIVKVISEGEDATLGRFKHYMRKEIFEEPEVIARVANSNPKEILPAVELIKKAFGVYFTACGTAAYAGLAATYMFSKISQKHVNFAVGSEFPYFEHFLVKRSLLIAASQSGETMDTLEAVRAAKRHKATIMSLVNVGGSSLTRVSDVSILLKAGPERAVVSTKAYVSKLCYFLLFAYSLAGKSKGYGFQKGVALLQDTSRKISKLFKDGLEKSIQKLARRLAQKNHIYLIGRGLNYATALEGALKIKEASYIHAEGFAGGELKHGVIALIEKGTPCIVIVANDEARESILSNAAELAARGAFIIGISPFNNEVFNFWIKVPDVGLASPIINVVPLQLLGII